MADINFADDIFKFMFTKKQLLYFGSNVTGFYD